MKDEFSTASNFPDEGGRLFTIFNKNDPTPTATALKASDWQKASILILDKQNFHEKGELNINRLKIWVSGTARYSSLNSSVLWPDWAWKPEWDWIPLNFQNIELIEVGELSKSLSVMKKNDIVDLTSGSKDQCSDIIRIVLQSGLDITLVVQTHNGLLNLKTGHIAPNKGHLSIRERVWLSSGYIIDYPKKGNPIFGEVWNDSKFNVDKIAKKSTKWETGFDGVKIRPNIEYFKDKFSDVKKHYLDKLYRGKWLEHASAHMISTWPHSSETVIGPRLINPDFEQAIRITYFTLINQKWASELFLDSLEDFDKFHLHIQSDDLDLQHKRGVNNFTHSVEFDFIATLNSKILIGECKDSPGTSIEVLSRLTSLSKAIFPTNSIPIVVYSGYQCKSIRGVNLISYPALSDPNILDKIQHETIHTGANFPERFNIVMSQEHEPIEVKEEQNIPSLTSKEQESLIEKMINYCKNNPIKYIPEFIQILSRCGIPTEGRLNWITENLSEKLGFRIDTSEQNSVKWIIWNNLSEEE